LIDKEERMAQLYLPELLYAAGHPHAGVGLLVGSDGKVAALARPEDAPDAEVVSLKDKALLPGLANAHSHSFQRLFRGRAEGRIRGGDTFWTWREQMYRAAGFLAPADVFKVAQATFLEMLGAGITAVGEFHYLHNQPSGVAYDDPNLLALEVIRAAESVGIRICLLRTAYLRAGFEREPHPGQRRFYESGPAYLENLKELRKSVAGRPQVSVGAAPHSIRAVPLPVMEEIAGYAARDQLPLHLHISEQVGENEACQSEYGRTPVNLAAEHGILGRRTTLVHSIHLTEAEFGLVAQTGATICSCPTTERNLGDGIFPADRVARLGIPVAFGTDSQAQIDILEDARQSEYHLRLQHRERGILDLIHGEEIAARLLRSATVSGYRSLGMEGGSLAVGEPADFFTLDMNDLAILGVDRESLASQVVFAAGRSAIRDVAVSGRMVMRDGVHPLGNVIRESCRDVQRRFASDSKII
jgi:formimidoylglutamate deiminase